MQRLRRAGRGKLIEGIACSSPSEFEVTRNGPDNSFDVVSKVEIQEVRNAIDQALKEIRQRFDLKDSRSEVNLAEADKRFNWLRMGSTIWRRSKRFWAEAGEARRLAEEFDLWQG